MLFSEASDRVQDVHDDGQPREIKIQKASGGTAANYQTLHPSGWTPANHPHRTEDPQQSISGEEEHCAGKLITEQGAVSDQAHISTGYVDNHSAPQTADTEREQKIKFMDAIGARDRAVKLMEVAEHSRDRAILEKNKALQQVQNTKDVIAANEETFEQMNHTIKNLVRERNELRAANSQRVEEEYMKDAAVRAYVQPEDYGLDIETRRGIEQFVREVQPQYMARRGGVRYGALNNVSALQAVQPAGVVSGYSDGFTATLAAHGLPFGPITTISVAQYGYGPINNTLNNSSSINNTLIDNTSTNNTPISSTPINTAPVDITATPQYGQTTNVSTQPLVPHTGLFSTHSNRSNTTSAPQVRLGSFHPDATEEEMIYTGISTRATESDAGLGVFLRNAANVGKNGVR